VIVERVDFFISHASRVGEHAVGDDDLGEPADLGAGAAVAQPGRSGVVRMISS